MTVQQAFEIALQHQKAGRLVEAEDAFRRILALEPRHADALFSLGQVASRTGTPTAAADFIRRAVAENPGAAAWHNELGNVLCDLGRFDEAMAAYQKAVELEPGLVEAHNNLATVLGELGRHEEAVGVFRRTIALRPGLAEAHVNLGIALDALGRHEEAAAAHRRAVELRPDSAPAHAGLGDVLRELDRPGEAEAAYRRALAIDPDFAEAHSSLGFALKEQGRLEEAVAACRRALEIRPDFADALNNLGTALRELGRLDEAGASLRRALELQPGLAETMGNLANVLAAQGRVGEAAPLYRRALELKPGFHGARFNYSLLLLLLGDFERGWPLYEARWETLLRASKRPLPQPRWDGGPLRGRRLLVHAEQGFGDAIQFVRYVPRIAASGATVLIECPGPLAELFGTVKGATRVVSAGTPLPAFDLHMPMLSLPLVFKTTPDTIPREVPYLSADPARCETWRARFGNDRSRLRVGLGWAGNPRHRGDRFRSLRLQQLLPLLETGGVDFFSLQKDRGAEEIRALPADAAIPDHTKFLENFADTAAMLMQLDLVISADTAIVHLAGALGRPVWTLLPFAPDWRWMLGRTDSPWYPTMRLFRQKKPLEWEPVITEVRGQLQALAASRK